MPKNSKLEQSGFAIAIAWPETWCKQPSAWYDPLMALLGFSKNNYYKVGHAAVVLIDNKNNTSQYFDFGRYHAPFQHGRVRGSETDFDLRMISVPRFSEDRHTILNYREILDELQNRKACHGYGELFASYIPIDYQSAFQKAMQMQNRGPIPYGPFIINGSNCSRFVNTVIRAGRPGWMRNFKLKFLVPLTPTTLNNVSPLEHRISLSGKNREGQFFPLKKLSKEVQKGTLPAPVRDDKIPENAQWLSGEGAGSWFVWENASAHLKVSRYSPEGNIECTGLYENPNPSNAHPDNSYQIDYPSNCKVVTFIKGVSRLHFERVRI